MGALAVLEAAFGRAAAEGSPRRVWWRDDDAVRVGPRLERLTALAARHRASLALAVIPYGADASVLAHCERHGHVVLQHGASHSNHQPSGKPAELGDARDVDAIVAELVAARRALASPAFLPVMVPPWNRMRGNLDGPLAAAGYVGVSLFGGPTRDGPLARVDTHLDPVDWRGGRGLLATPSLSRMAEAAVASGGPIGLLTHHAVHKGDVWEFVDAVAALVARHPGAAWASARELFGGA